MHRTQPRTCRVRDAQGWHGSLPPERSASSVPGLACASRVLSTWQEVGGGHQGPLRRTRTGPCPAVPGPLLPVGLPCPGASATPPPASTSSPVRSTRPHPGILFLLVPHQPQQHAWHPCLALSRPRLLPPPHRSQPHTEPRPPPSPGRGPWGLWGYSALTLLSPVRGLPLHGGHRAVHW